MLASCDQMTLHSAWQQSQGSDHSDASRAALRGVGRQIFYLSTDPKIVMQQGAEQSNQGRAYMARTLDAQQGEFTPSVKAVFEMSHPSEVKQRPAVL